MSQSGFASWIAQQQTANAPGTSQLPPYHSIYFPDPIVRAG
jgi:hypothetical protein